MKKIKLIILSLILVGGCALNAQTLSKSYNRYGLSMNYPSFLSIEDEDYTEGELTLELVNEDETCGMYIVVIEDEEVGLMLELLAIEDIFDVFKEELASDLSDASFGGLKKSDDNTVSQSFSVKEDGVTLYGNMIFHAEDDKFIIVLLIADDTKKMNVLKDAYETINVL